jgi:hypothetical protein
LEDDADFTVREAEVLIALLSVGMNRTSNITEDDEDMLPWDLLHLGLSPWSEALESARPVPAGAVGRDTPALDAAAQGAEATHRSCEARRHAGAAFLAGGGGVRTGEDEADADHGHSQDGPQASRFDGPGEAAACITAAAWTERQADKAPGGDSEGDSEGDSDAMEGMVWVRKVRARAPLTARQPRFATRVGP